MIFAKIKSKEKKKSHTFKMTISKKDVNGVVVSVEQLKELKKELLNQISFELDTFIIDMIEDKKEVETDKLIEILEDLAYKNVLRLRKVYNDQRLQESLDLMANFQGDPNDMNDLLVNFIRLKEVQKNISQELGTVIEK